MTVSKFKKLVLPCSILAIGFLSIFLISATKPTPSANPDLLKEPPKPKVAITPAVREIVVISVKSQGTVRAKRDINVVAQVSGLVVSVSESFVSGDFFENNDVLIKIDDRDYKTALLNAQSRLAQAKRKLAEEKGRSRQAKREWRDLKNKDANDLFLRKPQLAEAQAEVEYAQANVDLAKVNVERTKIRVPFNGRIKQTLVNIGQFVTTGTRLAEVYDTASVEVRLPLSDRQIALLDLPVTGTDISNKPKVNLTGIIGGKKHQWQAQITRTEASVDVNSRMYYAIAEVSKPFETYTTAPLIPGLFVQADIDGKELNDVLVLPIDVVVNRKNIYTINDKNIIESTPVTVLNKNGQQVWLQANVADNTPILVEKHAVVSVGTEVEPYNPANPNKEDVSASDEVSVAKVIGK